MKDKACFEMQKTIKDTGKKQKVTHVRKQRHSKQKQREYFHVQNRKPLKMADSTVTLLTSVGLNLAMTLLSVARFLVAGAALSDNCEPNVLDD
jgi:hypothetical protein